MATIAVSPDSVTIHEGGRSHTGKGDASAFFGFINQWHKEAIGFDSLYCHNDMLCDICHDMKNAEALDLANRV